jgi:BA14K-like protein
LSEQKNRNAPVFEQFAAHHYMEKTVMTHLKFLTTAAVLVVSLASTPVFAQSAPFYYGPEGGPAPYYGQNWGYNNSYYGQNWTYDNSGWNGYNNGGYNNTWFDGRNYRSDPRPPGEAFAADAASRVPFRGYANDYDGSYAFMGDDESVSVSDQTSCEQRYKSYDPASGTYLGYDGRRHACR